MEPILKVRVVVFVFLQAVLTKVKIRIRTGDAHQRCSKKEKEDDEKVQYSMHVVILKNDLCVHISIVGTV